MPAIAFDVPKHCSVENDCDGVRYRSTQPVGQNPRRGVNANLVETQRAHVHVFPVFLTWGGTHPFPLASNVANEAGAGDHDDCRVQNIRGTSIVPPCQPMSRNARSTRSTGQNKNTKTPGVFACRFLPECNLPSTDQKRRDRSREGVLRNVEVSHCRECRPRRHDCAGQLVVGYRQSPVFEQCDVTRSAVTNMTKAMASKPAGI